jgi:hypothetical protein
MFGGVERKPGKAFIVPVPDRSVDTSMAIISDWMEPGTEVTSTAGWQKLKRRVTHTKL